MHMAGGGMHRGGRGDARTSCASPLGTPLPSVFSSHLMYTVIFSKKTTTSVVDPGSIYVEVDPNPVHVSDPDPGILWPKFVIFYK